MFVSYLMLTWWRFTSTCLISLICVNSSRRTCLPNLTVMFLMEMEIWIFISIPTSITLKKLNLQPQCAILRNFQNQEYRCTISKSLTLLAKTTTTTTRTHVSNCKVVRFSCKCKNVYQQITSNWTHTYVISY